MKLHSLTVFLLTFGGSNMGCFCWRTKRQTIDWTSRIHHMGRVGTIALVGCFSQRFLFISLLELRRVALRELHQLRKMVLFEFGTSLGNK